MKHPVSHVFHTSTVLWLRVYFIVKYMGFEICPIKSNKQYLKLQKVNILEHAISDFKSSSKTSIWAYK